MPEELKFKKIDKLYDLGMLFKQAHEEGIMPVRIACEDILFPLEVCINSSFDTGKGKFGLGEIVLGLAKDMGLPPGILSTSRNFNYESGKPYSVDLVYTPR